MPICGRALGALSGTDVHLTLGQGTLSLLFGQSRGRVGRCVWQCVSQSSWLLLRQVVESVHQNSGPLPEMHQNSGPLPETVYRLRIMGGTASGAVLVRSSGFHGLREDEEEATLRLNRVIDAVLAPESLEDLTKLLDYWRPRGVILSCHHYGKGPIFATSFFPPSVLYSEESHPVVLHLS